ncbi:MAG: sigma-54-dependent Fis family transcriptional regulator [Ignavibacteriaceae bacterium]|nr:sigma-54-dependent Fis family transcriptional regulator [Ignavibacteriaceae bacterium]
MFEKFEELIEQKDFKSLKNLCDEELFSISGANSQEDHLYFEKILEYRILANNKLGLLDDEIRHTIWKMKNPFIKEIDFIDGKKIRLIESHAYMFKCDAFVNTMHLTKHFDYSKKSFSHDLLHKLGKEEIDRQIEIEAGFEKKCFLKLEHENLSAPQSFHIPAVIEDNKIDYDVLEKGIKNILEYASSKGLTKLGFVALGMETTNDISVKELIIDSIISEIQSFIKTTHYKRIPEINFLFINIHSFSLFEKAIVSYSELGRFNYLANEKLSQKQYALIRQMQTKDTEFIKELKKISYHLDEDTVVLILGETGVGKSYLAEAMHNLSSRSGQKFKGINCAINTGSFLYSNVFGFNPHSFSGTSRATGESIFEAAVNGTVFLDEIGYADYEFQTALLTFLDKKTYRKAGDQKDFKADVRIVLGTNQDLENLVREKKFLPDLYERIANQAVIKIPPLRSRVNDIALFADHVISEYNKEEKNNVKITLDPKAYEFLKNQKFPGNVRQLKYYLEKKIADCKFQRINTITEAILKEDPPRAYRLDSSNSPFEILENLLKEFLSKWDSESDGKFKNDFLDPLLSKIYLHDLSGLYKKTDSYRILGIDGTRGDKGIEEKAKQYEKITEKFKNF